MVKNRRQYDELIDSYNRKNPLTYKQAQRLFEAMWEEAKAVGVLPPRNPLDGIETDIKIAKILNSCLKK